MPKLVTYKRPESVLVIVYDHTGQFLLLRRVEPADHWQSVTGSLEWGETPATAARRELQEETGICGALLRDLHTCRDFPIVPPWRQRYAPEATHNREHWFALAVEQPMTPALSPSEHDAFVWLPGHEAIQKVFSWTNRDAILAILAEQAG